MTDTVSLSRSLPRFRDDTNAQEKQERERRENAEKAKQGVKVASASELRLQKGEVPRRLPSEERRRGSQTNRTLPRPLRFPPPDISELNLPKQIKISFPDGPDKLDRFDITCLPDEGDYK